MKNLMYLCLFVLAIGSYACQSEGSQASGEIEALETDLKTNFSADKTKELLGKLRRKLDTVHSLCVDVSDARAIIRFQGDNAREVLSRTICIEIDAYRAAAAGTGDEFLTITMVAAAQITSDPTFT